MLRYALIFFVISIIAGALGFSNVASGARGISKILFGLFLIVAIIIVIVALLAGQLIF